MLRTKKKQLNLKPNRVLDKRSSRGMLYENEELRLRTIHINDEVEKGHHDIKKLRKENEYLKREIWSLRDECEKLEEVIKKVYAGDPPLPDELPTYQPHIRKHSTGSTSWNRRESSLHLSNYGDDCDEIDDDEDAEEFSEETRIRPDFNDEETSTTDPPEMTTSGESDNHRVYELYSPLQPYNPEEVHTTTELSSSDEYATSVQQYYAENPSELEAVTEENEFSSSSVQSVNQQQQPIGFEQLTSTAANETNLLHFPPDDLHFIDSRSASGNSDNASDRDELQVPEERGKNVYTACHLNLRTTPGFQPKIQITPASSQSSATCLRTENEDESQLPQQISQTNTQIVHDLGCVTVVPKKYQVTSQLKIGEQPPATPDSPPPPSDQNPIRKRPPRSSKTNPSSNTGTSQPNQPKPCQFYPGNPRVHSFHSDSLGKTCTHQNPVLPYYQSEPSLSSSSSVLQESHHYLQRAPVPDRQWAAQSTRDSTNFLILSNLSTLEPGFHGFDNSIGMCGLTSSEFDPFFLPTGTGAMIGGWNSVDKNVVIGFLDDTWNNLQEELTAQEVIDELEAQFDPSLEKIAGVRMLISPSTGHHHANRIFISFRQPSGVKALIENGLTLRHRSLKLMDANSTPTVSLLLPGLPSSVPDTLVISALNQFGQVVAPLERRIYKGVDISERFAKMHLVKSFPTHPLHIAGYEILAKLVTKPEIMAPSTVPPLTTSSNNYLQPETRSHHDLFQEQHLTTQSPPSSASLPSIRTHKPVIRSATLDCSTSLTPNPHQCISANVGPTAAAIQKRKMSICSAIIDANANVNPNPSNLPQGGQRVSVTITGKKPLQRISSIKPPAPPTPVLPHVEQDESFKPGRQVVNRSLSFDPRKISSMSAIKALPGVGSEQSLTDSIPSQGQRTSSIRGIPISRQPSRIYGGQRRSSSANNNNIVSLDKKEPLPWCGCWGNGCV